MALLIHLLDQYQTTNPTQRTLIKVYNEIDDLMKYIYLCMYSPQAFLFYLHITC